MKRDWMRLTPNVTNEVSGVALAAYKISRCVRNLDWLSSESDFSVLRPSGAGLSLVGPAKLLELTF